MPNPNVKEMLEVGQTCGLTYVTEAYSNYIRQPYMFFLIEDIENQSKKFHKELLELNLVDVHNGSLQWVTEDMTIEEALTSV